MSVVFLRCRPACPQDLEECLIKIRDYDFHTETSRAALLQMWRTLLPTGCVNFAVIEDSDLPLGQRILWFSFKVFVTDEYLRFMRTQMSPCLSLQLLTNWQGDRSAVMDLAALRRANRRAGVHMVTLNYGTPRSHLTGEKRDWIASKSVEWSWYSAGGYHVQSMHLELYGEYEWAWARGFGLHLQNDYGNYEKRSMQADSPCLFGISRSEEHTGTQMSVLFRSQRPCFSLKPSEQELLLWAMMDITDDELAERLNLATVTIKKRWQSIYERVAMSNPDLLGTICDTKRGTEKKRRLLGYLRHHMEELRPIEHQL